jgi:hypothetical protein
MIAAVVGGALALSLVAAATSPHHRPRAVVVAASTKPNLIATQDLLPLLTKAYEPWADSFVTLEQLDLFLRDARRNLTGGAAPIPPPNNDDRNPLLPLPTDQLAVVVMASAGEEGRRRARTIVDTWWRWLAPGTGRLCADADDTELGLATLPSLEGRPTYEDAQRRQPECLKWYYERDYGTLAAWKGGGGGGTKKEAAGGKAAPPVPPPPPSWYLLADDDTWVNVPLVRLFTARYDPDLPLLIGHAYDWPLDEGEGEELAAQGGGGGKDKARRTKKQKKITLGGGAGMLLSRGAFLRMVPRMAEDDARVVAADADADSSSSAPCAAAGFNDVTLPNCARETGVLLVHSELFDGHDRGRDAPNPSAGHLAVHRVTDKGHARRLCCDAAERYGFGWGLGSSSSSPSLSWRDECAGV